MDWDEKAESYINENYELFAGGRLTRVLTRHVQAGIEAVRALRKENEKLQEKLYAENGHAKQFHASLVERTRECDGLRKENEDLEQAKQSWIKRAEEENARAERLEKEKERQQQDIESYRAIVDAYQKAETQKDLRDEFAVAGFLVLNLYDMGDEEIRDVARKYFVFSEAMTEARKK